MSELIDGLPKHDELFWPVIQALRTLDGSADNEQLVEKVSELLGVDDELTATPHKAGPQTEIVYRIAWVKSWLKWGLMVDNQRRAVWVLTERGRAATEKQANAVRQRRRAEAARKPARTRIRPGQMHRIAGNAALLHVTGEVRAGLGWVAANRTVASSYESHIA